MLPTGTPDPSDSKMQCPDKNLLISSRRNSKEDPVSFRFLQRCVRNHFSRAIVVLLFLTLSLSGQKPQVNSLAPKAKAPAPAESPTSGTHELSPQDVSAFLDGIMPQQLATDDIAGAVISIVKDGKVIFAKGYGYSDMEKRTPVSPDNTPSARDRSQNCLRGRRSCSWSSKASSTSTAM